MAPLKPPKTRKVSAAQAALDLRDPGQPTLGEVTSWYTREYLSSTGAGEEQRALSTRRGFKTTVKVALAHFGHQATPTRGETRAWLRPMLESEGGKLRARSVNAHRDRLHAAYVAYRDQVRGVTLNPFAFPRFREDYNHLRANVEAVAAAWPALRAAQPDARARLFIGLAYRLGWRLGELLGLEEGHVMRTTAGQYVVRKEQQRRLWEDVPKGLKHDGLCGTFKLHPELVADLHELVRAKEKGTTLLGCGRGALVGDRLCADGAERRFLFPYREVHLAVLTARLKQACPAEFGVSVRRAPS